MATGAQLALTATALETAAGASTTANANESGYWKRIATAAEAIAGTSSSANSTREGYMLRAAVALEGIAGTTGAEENRNFTGTLKRVVDALEVQAGGSTTGSLGQRLRVAAQTATFAAEIVYVGGKTASIPASSGTNTNIVLTDLTGGLAAAPSAGDYVIVGYSNASAGDDNLSVITAGYTEVCEPFANDSDDSNLSISTKFMSGSPDTSVDVGPTGFAGRPGAVAIQVWRNVDATTPLDVARAIVTATSDPAVNPPAIGPRSRNAKIVVFGTKAANATLTAYSATGLDNFIQQTRDEGGDSVRIGAGSKDWDNATTFDPVVWTGATSATGGTMAAVTLALRPSGAADVGVSHVQFLTRFAAATPTDEISAASGTLFGNASCDTTNKQLVLDGTGDYATWVGTAIDDEMTSDWTLECHTTAQGSNMGIVARGNSDSNQGRFVLYMNTSGGTIEFYAKLESAATALIVGASGIGGVGSNRHIAVCRQGTTYRLYVQGVQVASATNASAILSSSENLFIGADPLTSPQRFVNGRIGRVKISRRCVYPDGTAFTPPLMSDA